MTGAGLFLDVFVAAVVVFGACAAVMLPIVAWARFAIRRGIGMLTYLFAAIVYTALVIATVVTVADRAGWVTW